MQHFDEGRVGKAMAIVQDGLQANPSSDARALFLSLSGYRSYINNDHAQALKDLEQSVALLPECRDLAATEKADVFYRLADICEQMRNIVTGLSAIRGSIDVLVELDDMTRLRRSLAAKGRLHYLMRQYDKSLEAFEMSLSCEGPDPEAWKLYHGIAKCYDKLGDKDKARKSYEASRRSVMKRAKDRFGQLASDAGQSPSGSLLVTGGGDQPTGDQTDASVQANSDSSDNASPNAELKARIAESVRPTPTPVPTPSPLANLSPSPPPFPSAQASLAEARPRERSVSEAYPREALLESLKSPEIPGPAGSEPLASELNKASAARSGEDTVALSPQELGSSHERTRVPRRTVLTLTFAALPASLALFLLGLWFGHSSSQTFLNQANSELQALRQSVTKTENDRLKERAELSTSLARAELRAARRAPAAAWAARARALWDGLAARQPDSDAASRAQVSESIAREAIAGGHWSWSLPQACKAPARSLSVSVDGHCVALVGAGGELKSWSTLTGESSELALEHAALMAGGAQFVARASNNVLIGLSETGAWSALTIANDGSAQVLAREVGRGFLALRAAPSGERLASLDAQGRIQVWSLATGQSLGPAFALARPTTAFSFLQDEGLLIAADETGALRLVDAAGALRQEILDAHEGPLAALATSQSGQTIASVGQSGRLRLWRFSQGRLEALAEQWLNKPCALAVEEQRSAIRVALASDTGLIIDRFEQRWERELNILEREVIKQLCFLKHGGSILASSQDGALRLWRLPAVSEAPKAQSLKLNSPAQGTIASTSRRLALRLQDSTTTLLNAEGDSWTPVTGAISEALARPQTTWPSLSDDAQRLALLVGDKDIHIWPIEGAAEAQKLRAESSLVAMALLGNGERVLAANNAGQLVLLDARPQTNGAVLTTYPAPSSVEGPIQRIIAAPGGAVAVLLHRSGALRLWRARASGAPLEQLSAGAEPAPAIAFSPDGRILAISRPDGSIRRWRFDARGSLDLLPDSGAGPAVTALAFSCDGSALALARGNAIELRSLAGDLLTSVNLDAQCQTLAVVAGPRLLCGLQDGRLESFDILGPSLFEARFRSSPEQYIEALTGIRIKDGEAIGASR